MLETEITMEPQIARQHYLAYRSLKEEQRTKEDEQIQRSYLELSRGHAIINASKALEHAGLGEDGRPRIAFCRASAKWCYGYFRGPDHDRRIRYCDRRWPNKNYRVGVLEVPCPVPYTVHSARTIVPPIPPAHRPAGSLERYWLMWEVAEGGWEEVPRDPALLRRLNATTFSVLAVWDLTEVERLVLEGRSRDE